MEKTQLKRQAKTGFSHLLNELMLRKSLTAPEVYKAAWIDRRLFSKIANLLSNHIPTKPNVIALALAMKLDQKESKDFIKRAGYILTHGLAFDRVILECIDEKIYDLERVNQRLEQEGLPLINVTK
jgi:hypothetical protein